MTNQNQNLCFPPKAPLNADLLSALYKVQETLYVDSRGNLVEPGNGDLKGVIPAVSPSDFGSADFKNAYGLKYAYVGGAMVAGITSVRMVEALAAEGFLGVFGSSGLPPAVVEDKIVALKNSLGGKCFGACLINSPHDPGWEEAVVEIYLKHDLPMIEASAFMQLSLPLLRYRLTGLTRLPDGSIRAPHKVMAKVSRVELGKRFFGPAPEKLVKELVLRGWITPGEAELSAGVPVAGDVTAEADSGGHTDFRPAVALWPSMINLAAELSQKYNYAEPLRVGAAGGIGTPWALLAAQIMGADYFVTGSINQSCLESGLPAGGRELLGRASPTDVLQGPAADMFELGARVQVLKFGTLYAMRAQRLADAYKRSSSLDDLSPEDRDFMETNIFKAPLAQIWEETKAYFQQHDPTQIDKAEADPKHKMALVFRWYLGQSTRWAINGLEDRRPDWQIFCGPAQGAFNEWARGTALEEVANRKTVDLALNLLYGAAVLKRFDWARMLGVLPPTVSVELKPQTAAGLAARLT